MIFEIINNMEPYLEYILFAAIAIIAIIIIIALRGKSNKKNSQLLLDQIVEESPFRKQQVGPKLPHNEMRLRHREKEKEKELEKQKMSGNISIYDPEGLVKEREEQENQIVGLAETKGIWTRLIMSQKINFLRVMGMQAKKGFFWRTTIKAQDIGQGKSQGRGR